jgi:hypothetical protein
MTLKNTVGTLAQGAVSTAVSAVRHPISTASMAAGLVKGTAEASVDLVRGVVRGQGAAAAPVSDPVAATVVDQVEEQAEDRVEEQVDVPTQRQGTTADVSAPAATEAQDAPREPEVVPKPVPEIDELPEPVVIEADDTPGEAFHTEPKAASRDSEHGGLPGDREEAEGYVEEIPSEITDETAEDTLVWTSEASAEAPEAADINKG